MASRFIFRLFIFLIPLLLMFEAGIRFVGTYNEDGQFLLMDEPLLPETLPVNAYAESLSRFQERTANGEGVIYDPMIGWRPYPNVGETNALGMRTGDPDKNYTQEPDPDVLRVAIFGDSFTWAAEVSFEESWGNQLELALEARGIQAEVLNFGIPGTSLDQAYYYWDSVARDYKPDVVVNAFQSRSFRESTNIFRFFLLRETGIPLSKPRFIITENNQIEIINQPTIPVEELIDTIRNFDDHPLRKYEAYYNPNDNPLWSISKFAALLYRVFGPQGDDPLTFDSEEMQVSLAIINYFGTSVRETGAHYIALHMFDQATMETYFQTGQISYGRFLEAVEAENVMVDTRYTFETALDEYWMPDGHYSPSSSGILASALADEIERCLNTPDCSIGRF